MKDVRRQEVHKTGGGGGGVLPVLSGLKMRGKFSKQRTSISQDDTELIGRNTSSPEPPGNRIKRAATMVLQRKPNNLPEQSSATRSSIFYQDKEGVDVTTIFIRPDRDFPALNLNSLSMIGVLKALENEIQELNNMIMPMSTGTGTINMTVREYLYVHVHVLIKNNDRYKYDRERIFVSTCVYMCMLIVVHVHVHVHGHVYVLINSK